VKAVKRAIAYPIAAVLIFAIMYGQSPGYPLRNWWQGRSRK
jgi:hypothetical protein